MISITPDLRKGCRIEIGMLTIDPPYHYELCGDNNKLCEVCQAKLDQTLLCEKIANERIERQHKAFMDASLLREIKVGELKQMHKDFVEKLNKLRDELYEKLPVGDINAFDLIRTLKCHINKLDELKAELKSEDKNV